MGERPLSVSRRLERVGCIDKKEEKRLDLQAENERAVDQHYLRAVTALGDERNIVSACDIHSQSGIKLVAAGIRITSSLYEKLVRHKLLPSLDKALVADGMLSMPQVLNDLKELLGQNACLDMLWEKTSRGGTCQQILSGFQLPSALAFKITVAKEKFPKIYQHSLLFMVISTHLARCDGMNDQDVKWVALASLFHDAGLLHIDPALLEPSHVMTTIERKHLYAHPLTAYLLLSEFPELPRVVANAVLEHHERMDGSGYPRGLRGDKISRMGQVMAVAEVAAKAFDSDNPDIPWKKLEVMLKLNSRKFGPGLIGHLAVFKDFSEGVREGVAFEKLSTQVRYVAKLFEDFSQAGCEQCDQEVQDFALGRLEGLRLGLFEAGFDPRDPEGLIQMFVNDPESMHDYAPLLDEAIWQFKSLLQEVARRWGKTDSGMEREGVASCAWVNEMHVTLAAYAAEVH